MIRRDPVKHRAGVMLAQRLRRWPDIVPALCQRLLCTGGRLVLDSEADIT